MSLLLQRVECMKEYSRLAGFAEESELRGDWREAALLWEKAAKIGQQINHGEGAIERAESCQRNMREPNNDDAIPVAP